MSEAEQNSEHKLSKKLETGISISKEISSLFKELILLSLFIMLLIWPENFNSLLTRAGFEEGSVVGFKWKKQLDNTNNDLNGAKQIIEDLKLRINAANDVLKKVHASTNDAELKKELEYLVGKNEEASQAASTADTSIARTLQSNEPLITLAQQNLYSDSTSWGVREHLVCDKKTLSLR
ncbi:MAG: hypothetical protein PHH59_15380 [Methylovulum sp.]|uniref:hypothetical protein n=1 Tax=Methylovulum sp. TaxID=1916980 RepID=UPI0026094C6A|nr:hypothetical protein [Methylovulum sp.]MDD2725387.1 hypothetical protein [Methylovulum sp.]MDD5125552.1 hypothetical protein [Methylovulum sp.]